MRKGAAPVVLRLLPWLLPAVLLAAWGLAGATGWMPGYLLPEPGRIAGSFSLYLFGQAGSAPYAGRFSIDAAASLARIWLQVILTNTSKYSNFLKEALRIRERRVK